MFNCEKWALIDNGIFNHTAVNGLHALTFKSEMPVFIYSLLILGFYS